MILINRLKNNKINFEEACMTFILGEDSKAIGKIKF